MRSHGLDAVVDHISELTGVVALGFDGKNRVKNYRQASECAESITIVEFPSKAYLTHFEAPSS
ncbi:hypothetical protein Ciccas_010625, partial [Cichlidogyrus casuarinus]